MTDIRRANGVPKNQLLSFIHTLKKGKEDNCDDYQFDTERPMYITTQTVKKKILIKEKR